MKTPPPLFCVCWCFCDANPRRHKQKLCACRWPLLTDRRPNRNEMWNLESDHLVLLRLSCPPVLSMTSNARSLDDERREFHADTAFQQPTKNFRINHHQPMPTEHWETVAVNETNDVAQLLIGVNNNNNDSINLQNIKRTIPTKGLLTVHNP